MIKCFIPVVLFAFPGRQSSLALSHPKSSISPNKQIQSNELSSTNSNTNQPSSRRSFLSAAPTLSFVPMAISTVLTNNPTPAQALKPKNDALCGTGFFEHIYEYKCTAIGDIEDEGKTKKMNSNEIGITDSLMGKLNISDDLSGSTDSILSESKNSRSKSNRNNNQATEKEMLK